MIEVIGPHRAKLVAVGNTLECRECGKTVMTLLDHPESRPKPARGRGR